MKKNKLPQWDTEKCTRIVRYSAQTDNGLSVYGPLYIGVAYFEYFFLYA